MFFDKDKTYTLISKNNPLYSNSGECLGVEVTGIKGRNIARIEDVEFIDRLSDGELGTKTVFFVDCPSLMFTHPTTEDCATEVHVWFLTANGEEARPAEEGWHSQMISQQGCITLDKELCEILRATGGS